MLNFCRITMETKNAGGTGLTELYIDEARSVIMVYPGDGIGLYLSDPEVAHGWEILKGRIRGFAEFILRIGCDNSTGACVERFARESSINSESFHIEAYIGDEGNEVAADLYIDGDATVCLALIDPKLGHSASDTVAFFSDHIGPSSETESPSELAKRWEELKKQIRVFADHRATIEDPMEEASA